jgi:XRE family aerobic/anaerobic benzoate catabolism transcriptional regulator
MHLHTMIESATPAQNSGSSEGGTRLAAFGERVRAMRARRGLTRKALASGAGVSSRYIISLEFGRANPSLGVIEQVARALGTSVAELTGDPTASSPEWLLIRELLEGRSDQDLRRARLAIGEALGTGGNRRKDSRRVALIGLRGAGKSTLGRLLSEHLGLPFIELGREVERVAGMDIRTIHDLYGPLAYRRYERRALEEIVQLHDEAVIATPGGLVSDAATFNLLLSHCLTVWLRATPEDHMSRVVQQGDHRPMAGNSEAMEDLRRILSGRAAFYAKADVVIDTSAQPLHETSELIRAAVTQHVT